MKNSILGKCLRVLLIGYFLMSSINISGSLGGIIANNSEKHCLVGKTCQMLKKLFKCDTMLEELDDYETSKTKADKNCKGLQLTDYLIPIYTGLPYNYSVSVEDNKAFDYDLAIPLNFYSKIHLPPPEVIL